MSLTTKLQHHLAGRSPAWRDDRVASWTEAGARHELTVVDGAVTAGHVVDARVAALTKGVVPTLAHAGTVSATAREAAADLGVALLDAAALPDPEPSLARAIAESVPVVAAPAEEVAEARAVAHEIAVAVEAEAVAATAAASARRDAPHAPAAAATDDAEVVVREALLAEAIVFLAAARAFDPIASSPAAPPLPASPPLLPAHEEVPLLPPAPEELEAALVLELAAADAALAVAEPAPPPDAPLTEPPLPWAPDPLPAPEEAAASVTAEEVAAMPWAHVPDPAPIAPAPPAPSPPEAEPDIELLPGSPRPRSPIEHPTLRPSWGLPWPRPTPPTDGLAIADPAVWANRERVQAVRERLEVQGSASFGALKPTGSAWLKRIQTFEGP